MKKPKLNFNDDFVVKESQTINIIAGSALLAVFLISMAINGGGLLNALSLLILPAGFFFAKATRNSPIIIINKEGVFYNNKLVTNWTDYFDTNVSQKEVVGSFQDNFILSIRYFNSTRSIVYTETIPLTNTQNKSEEEILEAIDFY